MRTPPSYRARLPLRLTLRQCMVLDSLTRLGSCRLVQLELGFKQESDVQHLLARAARRAGIKSRLLLALEYDRWAREQEKTA